MTGSDSLRARRRLRLGISLFVLALAVPSALLVYKAYDQMKWEAFRQLQLAAEELASRIDAEFAEVARREDARASADYRFLRDADDGTTAYPRRSPLAELELPEPTPGLIGWFEVAPDGRFSSPLLPEDLYSAPRLGLTVAELDARMRRARAIEGILLGNRLAAPEGQAERQADRGEAQAAAPAAAPAPRETEALRDGAVAAQAAGRAAPVAKLAPTAPSNRLSQAAFERLAAPPKAFSADQKVPELAAVAPAPKAAALAAEAQAEAADKPDADVASAPPVAASADLVLEEAAFVTTAPSAPAAPELAAPELAAPEMTAPAETAAPPAALRRARVAPSAPVELFRSTVEPHQLGRLDSGHFILFRSVWRDGQRIIQGALIAQAPLLESLVGKVFVTTALARHTNLAIAYRDAQLARYRASGSRYSIANSAPITGTLLHRARLREPFGGLELVFRVEDLPHPPGALVIGWMAGALALVLLAGAWLMYRLGLRQIALVRQQQDFVSAVSHELKTPLTSIRMYAEMLRAGFASESRKATYYRFIHEESERLSRLIANVLQLARIGRDTLVLEPRPMALPELMAMVRERVASQVERAGFALEVECASAIWVEADPDAFVQILINLIDNALKFAATAATQRIEIHCAPLDKGWARVTVRDFGPGIPREQRRRVFQLFYRGPEASQRAVAGTGIGLALVQRLTQAMQGRVEVASADPGAELRIDLRIARQPPTA